MQREELPAVTSLDLDPELRRELWRSLFESIERYLSEVERLPVSPSTDPGGVRALLADVDFNEPRPPEQALALVLEGLRHHQVHNGHPRYFGLFNPATTTMSVAADALVAAFNPQLAAWTHAPFACEVEALLIRRLASKFGYSAEQAAGSFTSGGAEANHSALLAALVRSFPDFAEGGARALGGEPVLYVSSESHHSLVKAARLSGIGASAVHQVAVNEDFVMDAGALEAAVRKDRRAGRLPFLVVATLGTTGAGLLDPIEHIAEVGERESLWIHADAAWGGAAVFLPEMRTHLSGIERSDSITFDAHKWLGIPMGAGMFLTRHPELLERTFAVSTAYMPSAGEALDIVEPYRTSMQWTRRFIGLKLFLTLLVAGFEGYEETIRNMVSLGNRLRRRLEAEEFHLVNRTPLPVACFQDARQPEGSPSAHLKRIADHVVETGYAWVSTTLLGGKLPAIRACISNFRTRAEDVDALVGALCEARSAVGSNRE